MLLDVKNEFKEQTRQKFRDALARGEKLSY